MDYYGFFWLLTHHKEFFKDLKVFSWIWDFLNCKKFKDSYGFFDMMCCVLYMTQTSFEICNDSGEFKIVIRMICASYTTLNR